MPEFRFSIPQLLQQAFGVSGYRIDEPEPPSSPLYKEIRTVDLSEFAAYGPLGFPIYDVIRFKGGTVPGTDEIYESLDLVDYPLIQVSRQKNIVETAVAGRSGTVKELISNGDHSIQIRGILIEHDSEKVPLEKIQRLKRICDLPVAFEVESQVLNTLGIDSLVIRSYDFPPLEGFVNVQPYVLSCVSDEPVEAQILNNL